MDRGLVLAGIGAVGTFATGVLFVALLTVGGARAFAAATQAPTPVHAHARVARPVAIVANTPAAPRSHAGRIRTTNADGTETRTSKAAPATHRTTSTQAATSKAPTKKAAGTKASSTPEVTGDADWDALFAEDDAPPAPTVAPPAAPNPTATIDPSESLDDFEFVLDTADESASSRGH